jgi:hypothetical protein
MNGGYGFSSSVASDNDNYNNAEYLILNIIGYLVNQEFRLIV